MVTKGDSLFLSPRGHVLSHTKSEAVRVTGRKWNHNTQLQADTHLFVNIPLRDLELLFVFFALYSNPALSSGTCWFVNQYLDLLCTVSTRRTTLTHRLLKAIDPLHSDLWQRPCSTVMKDEEIMSVYIFVYRLPLSVQISSSQTLILSIQLNFPTSLVKNVVTLSEVDSWKVLHNALGMTSMTDTSTVCWFTGEEAWGQRGKPGN